MQLLRTPLIFCPSKCCNLLPAADDMITIPVYLISLKWNLDLWINRLVKHFLQHESRTKSYLMANILPFDGCAVIRSVLLLICQAILNIQENPKQVLGKYHSHHCYIVY